MPLSGISLLGGPECGTWDAPEAPCHSPKTRADSDHRRPASGASVQAGIKPRPVIAMVDEPGNRDLNDHAVFGDEQAVALGTYPAHFRCCPAKELRVHSKVLWDADAPSTTTRAQTMMLACCYVQQQREAPHGGAVSSL